MGRIINEGDSPVLRPLERGIYRLCGVNDAATLSGCLRLRSIITQ